MNRIRALPAAGPLLSRLDGTPPVFLVGGAVRDLLLGAQPLDLDFVVEGDAAALASRLGGELRAHDRFGTCTVRLDGVVYDLAAARRERYAWPGALPDVEPAPISEDLRRRDFTVNALAAGLSGRRAGEIIAVPGALADLQRRYLRVLHDASFVDDPTRLLRLVRYAARLGFTPEPHTEQLGRDAVAGGALATVSGDRIGTELRLLAAEATALSAFGWLARLRLDDAIHRGFGLSAPAMARGALELLPAGARCDRLLLGLAATGVAPDALPALLDALAFPAADRDVIVATARGADALARELQAARTPADIAAAAGRVPIEVVAAAGARGPREQARQWLTHLRNVRLQITGADLLAAGVSRGPAVGRGLRAALAAKLNGAAPDRAAELQHALAAASNP